MTRPPYVSPEPTALRADAVRNRAAVLEAARRQFAAGGLDAGMEEVADAAGVGVGTVYRHFPSKAALVDAVFETLIEEVSTHAEEALAEADAWEGFARLVERIAALTAENRGLRSVMRSRTRESEVLAARWAVAAGRIEEAVRRAQEQGAMRADVGLADVRAVFWGVGEVAEVAAETAPELWRRHLHLLLDGLRAPAATPMRTAAVGRARARRL